MVRLSALFILAFALAFAGCKPKPREVSKSARAEAAQLVSEADFATQIRDHARAETALRRAVELDPEFSGYWLQLGFACRRQNNLDGARTAYKKALSLREAAYSREKTAENALNQLEVLVLLGRADDARDLLEHIRKDHGSEFAVKSFIEQGILEKMIADPTFKSLML
jgi:Flp pilus assembly protein TadD